MSNLFEKIFLDNWKIKGYAFIVSVVLWSIILGQRSLVISKEVPVEYLISPDTIVQDSVDKIMVTISAKRSVLQKFVPENSAPMIDLRNLPPGSKRIPIKIESILMPIGAKVLAVEPKVVTLYLKVKTKRPNNLDSDTNLSEKEGYDE
ncbi:MAG: hypothetical protein ACRBBP_07585 [Bdellovibrionales bacterium]